jgi:hypothetical protein
MTSVLLPPGVNPIAVNKYTYIVSFHTYDDDDDDDNFVQFIILFFGLPSDDLRVFKVVTPAP